MPPLSTSRLISFMLDQITEAQYHIFNFCMKYFVKPVAMKKHFHVLLLFIKKSFVIRKDFSEFSVN